MSSGLDLRVVNFKSCVGLHAGHEDYLIKNYSMYKKLAEAARENLTLLYITIKLFMIFTLLVLP